MFSTLFIESIFSVLQGIFDIFIIFSEKSTVVGRQISICSSVVDFPLKK